MIAAVFPAFRPDYPKGACYDNALRYLALELDPEAAKVALLVHGTLHSTVNGIMGHAWIEIGGIMMDPSENLVMRTSLFEEVWGAMPDVKYTLAEAANIAMEADHTGPWENFGGHA